MPGKGAGVSQPLQPLSRREWGIVALIAAVQFVNVLDFVIVMPMGPELAAQLGFSKAHVGYINGAYTAAASLMGLLGSLFLDRFDRRSALAVALGALVIGTFAGSAAVSFETLLFARIIAGAGGGPATSLSFSIISDTIPNTHRGRAMGAVMGAFSVASVLGVPTGLWLSEKFGWRAPFMAVGAIGTVISIGSVALLPKMRGHLTAVRSDVTVFTLVQRPLVQLSYLLTATVMMAGFVIIPNIAGYLELNLGFPRPMLKYAYMVGGIASLFATQLGGRLVDRMGSVRVGAVGSALVVTVVFFFFYLHWSVASVPLVLIAFIAFMTANGLRNVSYNSLTSKVPEPAVRARFQSLQSAVQHGASAAAAFLSAKLLGATVWADGSSGPLFGMQNVALVSMSLTLLIPVLLFVLETRVNARNAARSAG